MIPVVHSKTEIKRGGHFDKLQLQFVKKLLPFFQGVVAEPAPDPIWGIRKIVTKRDKKV
ncbi:hypothetical protein HYV85_01920 [Candidatus Woesearchaeota archaeon]|nr:hypothetical protein [Candidatus Woesearchaeota archaeon]